MHFKIHSMISNSSNQEQPCLQETIFKGFNKWRTTQGMFVYHTHQGSGYVGAGAELSNECSKIIHTKNNYFNH